MADLRSCRSRTRRCGLFQFVAAAGDPVEAGVAESWAHPGGNVTGFRQQSPELSGKRLQLLKEASPTIQRVAVLWNSAAAIETSRLTSTEEAARALGLQLRTIEIATPDQIAAGFEAAVASGADGLYVLPATMFFDHRDQIITLAAKNRLPAIGPGRSFAVGGGLLSYSPKGTDLYRAAAVYVDKILKGANPGDLPIQQPTRYELVINPKTAKALGLTIAPSILALADEVIE
jgi:putative ABC transport system substrate-binding protein